MGEVDVYIKVISDPGAKERGFSILGRQFKPAFPAIYTTKAISIIDGREETVSVWIIAEKEYLRVVPEHENFRPTSQFWVFPAELCSPIVPTHGKFKKEVSQKELDFIKKIREEGIK